MAHGPDQSGKETPKSSRVYIMTREPPLLLQNLAQLLNILGQLLRRLIRVHLSPKRQQLASNNQTYILNREWGGKTTTHLLLLIRKRPPLPRQLGARLGRRALEAARGPPLLDEERVRARGPPGHALVRDLAVRLVRLAAEGRAGEVGVADLGGGVGLDPGLIVVGVGGAVGVRGGLEALFCFVSVGSFSEGV